MFKQIYKENNEIYIWHFEKFLILVDKYAFFL